MYVEILSYQITRHTKILLTLLYGTQQKMFLLTKATNKQRDRHIYINTHTYTYTASHSVPGTLSASLISLVESSVRDGSTAPLIWEPTTSEPTPFGESEA